MKLHPVFAAVVSFLVVPFVSQAAVFVYTASLDGPSESPPVPSPGTGSAMVIYNSAAHTLQVQATFSNLVGTTTSAHIHAPTAVAFTGTAGVATQVPSFVGFPLGVTAGSFDNTYDLTLPSSFNPAFITANGGTPASAEAALFNYINDGRAYFNIHTTFAGGGEIRGFLQPTPEGSGATIALLLPAIASLIALRRRWRFE